MHFFLKLFWLNNNLVCRFKINKFTFIKGDNNQWCCSTALWWRNKTQQAHWPESKGFWEWRADGTLTISRWSSTGTSDVAKDLQVVKHVKEKQIRLLLIHVNTLPWILRWYRTISAQNQWFIRLFMGWIKWKNKLSRCGNLGKRNPL